MAKDLGMGKIVKELKAPNPLRGVKPSLSKGMRAPRSDRGMKRMSYRQRMPGMGTMKRI